MTTSHATPVTHESALAAWRAGQPELARTYCRALLSASPHDQRALNLLAVIYGSCGMPQQALAPLETLSALRPQDPTVHNNLASALLELGRLDAAIRQYRRALELRPDYAGARYNLANALLRQGHLDEAIGDYRLALALAPELMDAHLQLGNALRQRGELDASLASLRQAAALRPDLPVVLESLGVTLRLAGAHDEAIATFHEALRRNPKYLPALRHLAAALVARGDAAAATVVYRRALELAPRDPALLSGLAAALAASGQPQESGEQHARAQMAAAGSGDRTDPTGAATDSFEDYVMRAAVLEMHRTLWDQAGIAADIEALRREVSAQDQAAAVPPHILMALDGDPQHQLHCAQIVARMFARRVEASADPVPDARSRPASAHRARGCRPCRVAFVSPDLRNHVVGLSMVDVLERLDRRRVEPIGIYIGPQDTSAAHLRCEKACGEFHRVLPRSDAQIAEFIRGREADIAVDLAGYTGFSRPEIFGHRAAPVQVQYLGFAGTMGSSWIDYIIADPFVIPAASVQHYSEKVAWLPESFFPIDPGMPAPPRIRRADEGLPQDCVVLAAFNDPVRVAPRMLQLWASILRRVPDAVLWLRGSNPPAQANMRAHLAAHGADPARLYFTRQVEPRERHLSRHALADLMLDTLPYNMHSTCRDSLWLGLPVLTCPGEAFASRVAGSLLSALGVPQLIATSSEDYVERAVALACDRNALQGLRRKVQDAAAASPLFDMDRLARHLETAFEMMRERHERGAPPAHFNVPSLDELSAAG